jgi:ABC-2 type transport system permease protein
MHKTLLVLRQELASTFARRSYLIFAFGIPILAIVILLVVKTFQGRAGGPSTSTSSAQTNYPQELEGYVDPDGLIRSLPKNVDGNVNRSWGLIAYPDGTAAKKAMKDGSIAAYYVIPTDYLETGKIQYVYPSSKSFMARGQEWTIEWALAANLVGNDLELAERAWNPVQQLHETVITVPGQAGSQASEDCSQPGSNCRSNTLIRLLPSIMAVLLYISLMASSSMLFNSVGIEKENRTIEVLMVSIHPRQLLAGKTIALGLAGLLQTVVWLGTTYIALNLGGTTLQIPENFSFPAEIVAWSLLLFLGGFVLYASLMAGAGALVPKMKEAGIANFIAMIPLMLGYLVGLFAPLADATDALLPIVLSMFPLTAPVLMVMRLVDSTVPWWQLLIAIGGTYLTAFLALRAAAAAFRAQNLLSGQPFSLGRYFRAMGGGR